MHAAVTIRIPHRRSPRIERRAACSRRAARVVVALMLSAWLTSSSTAARSYHSQASSAQIVEVTHNDGIDDGEALQQAIDLASTSGGAVHIHAGVYHLKIRNGIRALAPRKNAHIIGEGAAQ